MKNVGILVYCCLLLFACNEGKVYDRFQHTPLSGWEKNDTLTFDVPPMRQSGNYQAKLAMRINSSFPFKSLTLIVEQTVLPHRNKYVDTLDCELIGNNGIAQGRGISYYQYDFNITQLKLQQGDSLHIKVRHDMKREILPGISNVGITLIRK